jgi:hypothetical protein
MRLTFILTPNLCPLLFSAVSANGSYRNVEDPYTSAASKLLLASNLRSLRFHVRSYMFDERYPEATLRSFLDHFPKLNEFKLIMFQYEINLTIPDFMKSLYPGYLDC